MMLKESVEHIRNISSLVAVASGKGGVGKSTVSAYLAQALQLNGLKVGLLDADIYGPSVPRMMGGKEKPVATPHKTFLPLECHGVACMSMGFLVDEKSPMIWRGPMVQTAFKQLLYQVEWGTLDVLVIDLPPGTGDIQLTMAQQVPLTGALIVSTPQDIALIDACKGMAMFQKVGVPILGIVENMSYFSCNRCGERHFIFGQDGAVVEAKRQSVDCLAQIPLLSSLREAADQGVSLQALEEISEIYQTFKDLASKVQDKLDVNQSIG